MVNIYHFCDDNINDYEKTILRLAISFGVTDLYILDDDDIMDLSNLLKIEYHKLERALRIPDGEVNNFTSLKFGSEIYNGEFLFDYELFDIIFRCNFILRILGQTSNHSDKDHLKSNVELFESAAHHFEMINAKSATFECMYHNYFSHEFAIYLNSDFDPMDSIRLLKLSLFDSGYYEQNKDMLPIIYQLLYYEFYTRINTLYLISIIQIIKHSPFYNSEIRDIACEFYAHLLFMIRNARVISTQVNSLSQTIALEPELRTKRDNTTRLQVLYGFDNYDSYAIRLDLAHEGAGFIHYNNKSPGGIKSCLFNKDEYQEITEKYPQLVKFFIEYGDRWALKERSNCDMTEEEKERYDEVEKSKEHDPAFNKIYSEENVISFIELLGSMLPQRCYVPIDKEEIHARNCFNYDKIMGGVFYLYLAYYSDKKEIGKISEFIIERAANYNLISELDKKEYSCVDLIELIIALAKERAFGSV